MYPWKRPYRHWWIRFRRYRKSHTVYSWTLPLKTKIMIMRVTLKTAATTATAHGVESSLVYLVTMPRRRPKTFVCWPLVRTLIGVPTTARTRSRIGCAIKIQSFIALYPILPFRVVTRHTPMAWEAWRRFPATAKTTTTTTTNHTWSMRPISIVPTWSR